MTEEGSPVLPDSRRAVESPSSEMGDSSVQLAVSGARWPSG